MCIETCFNITIRHSQGKVLQLLGPLLDTLGSLMTGHRYPVGLGYFFKISVVLSVSRKDKRSDSCLINAHALALVHISALFEDHLTHFLSITFCSGNCWSLGTASFCLMRPNNTNFRSDNAVLQAFKPVKLCKTRVISKVIAGTPPPPAWPGRVPVPETFPQHNGPKASSLNEIQLIWV